MSTTLLDTTLAAAARDKETVTAAGASTSRLISGVKIKYLPTQTDDRGSLMEVYDPRWKFHDDPMVYCYMFTIRPGVVKGWGLHKQHEDRYVILHGHFELVLYDPRPESPTCGKVNRIVLSEHNRCIVNIPIHVWHADYNFGTTDAVVLNFPTTPYWHDAPDKWRLPIDTDLIPHKFPSGVRGG